MTRWIICAIVLATAGCSAGPGDSGLSEDLASVQQAASTCKNYDGYTAALAEATIDCLGTVGPYDYTSDASGFLVPSFERCPAEDVPPNEKPSAFARIRRLLSLQFRERQDFAPNAVPCIRDAYLIAAKSLAGNQITCPTWHKVFAGGVPNKRNAALITRRMPVPHNVVRPDGSQARVIDPPKRGSGFRFPKEYFFYAVDFDGKPPPEQACGRAESCARACASVFEGFFVGRFGRYIVGDPYWWLDPTSYGFNPTDDPYNRTNGFYHPMSLAGDDVPGEVYGDIARGAFDNPTDTDSTGSAEECTIWNGTDHVMGRLIQDKSIPIPDFYMSRCEKYPGSF